MFSLQKSLFWLLWLCTNDIKRLLSFNKFQLEEGTPCTLPILYDYTYSHTVWDNNTCTPIKGDLSQDRKLVCAFQTSDYNFSYQRESGIRNIVKNMYCFWWCAPPYDYNYSTSGKSNLLVSIALWLLCTMVSSLSLFPLLDILVGDVNLREWYNGDCD